MRSTDSLADLARPLLVEAGLELWDIEVGPTLVRILVDRPDGVDLETLSAATRALSPLLDEREDLVPTGPYDLEVSSPGIERTLRTPQQYRRYVGSLLAVKTTVTVGGARRFRATLLAVTDDPAVELLIEGATDPVTVALADIDRARTVLEWGSPAAKGPKANKPKGPKAAGKQQQKRSNRTTPVTEAAGPGANDKDSAP